MIRTPLALAALGLALTAATPVLAADTMSKSHMATAAKCKAMTPAAAKKNAKCVAFMKAHPSSMMSSEGGMMADDAMMSSEKKK